MKKWIVLVFVGLVFWSGAYFSGAARAADAEAKNGALSTQPGIDRERDSEVVAGPWATVPDPKLPNVLILGDSISVGYFMGVREKLSGKANVFRPQVQNGKRPENCQGTTHGIKRIDQWIAGHHWDVIHFNWGLHDLKHVDSATGKNSNSFDDPRQAEPDNYEKNLRTIVGKLNATGAKLILATTTGYPPGVKPARLPEDAELYNRIAVKIARDNNIAVNDLHAETSNQLESLQRPVNVHFNPKGNEVLSQKVSHAIIEAFKKK